MVKNLYFGQRLLFRIIELKYDGQEKKNNTNFSFNRNFCRSIDIAVINLAIPSIQEQFHITSETAQWLQTFYVLFLWRISYYWRKAFGSVRKKKIFLFGAFTFMLASLGAGLSTSFEVLAIFRALQGLCSIYNAFSCINCNKYIFWQNRNGTGQWQFWFFCCNRFGKWTVHWRDYKYLSKLALGLLINVPILLVTLIAAYYYLPADKPDKAAKTDMISAVFIVLGFLSLTYGVHELAHIKENPVIIIASLMLPVVFLKFVIYRLRTVSYPLVNLQIFRHKSLVISNLAFFSIRAFFHRFLFLISLMLQKDMGHDAASSGLMLVPFSILSALVAKYILPYISKRLNSFRMGALGWIFMLDRSIAFLLVSVFTDILWYLY